MSYLKEGNEAFRKREYIKAVELYKNALNFHPEMADIIKFNIRLSESRIEKNLSLPHLEPIKKLPITALVITWDVGHNPLGRSYMLAEALERAVRTVIICGFQFPRYGNDIWQPVRQGRLPVISLPGGDIGEWLESCERAVEKFKPDVVIACKPRLPSVELGILFKEKYNIPLIVDVDDHELSFFNDKSPLDISEIKNIKEEELKGEREPFNNLWTRLTDTLTKRYADEIITSNIALQKEFGGTIIPHVRDENAFDPIKFDKNEQRNKYKIPTHLKIVMFFGTPRVHKGVGVIAEAIGKIPDENVFLVVVGEAPDRGVTAQLDKLARGKVIFLPNQPFSAIPEIICMADLVVLPQDVNHPISQYQLPAKAIDAIAMGVPLLVSGTPPLMQLVNDQVATLLPEDRLDKVIETELMRSPDIDEKYEVRRRFLLGYSYHSAAQKLRNIVEKALKNQRKLLTGFEELKILQRRIFGNDKTKKQNNGHDIVVFWKQNDTGLYGRRHDMVIKYLASRNDINKVVVFDAPISLFDVDKMKGSDVLNQGRNVYTKLFQKLLGRYDNEKVSYNVFLHPPGIYTINPEERDRKPLFEGYSKYIKEVLEREGVDSTKAIFWIYPKNFLANELVNYFSPKKVVVDVVDDHRAWPNVSSEEKEKLTKHYHQILTRADMAFANCQPVIDSMKRFNGDIRLIPNGCEKSPEIIEPNNFPMFEELKNFGGKVIGFVGNLEAKIDIPLIEIIAKTFQDELVVLVGSTHANPETKVLQRYKNIRMFGVVPYENISSIVSKFDVGIVPHKKMKMTDNMNPLKVFVYLANRVPVVASKVSNLPVCDAIRVVDSHEEFCEEIRTLLKEKKLNKGILEFVEQNSWENRFSSVVDELLNN